MANRGPDRRFLLGLLVGAGVGLAAAYLFDPKRGRQNRERLIRGARRVANQVSLERGSRAWGERKIQRAGRKFEKRLDRIRSTGF